jgi:hypothetical protein
LQISGIQRVKDAPLRGGFTPTSLTHLSENCYSAMLGAKYEDLVRKAYLILFGLEVALKWP